MGTSGYHYEHSRGVFYPECLSSEIWFDHYARSFDTVEINNTFYHLPEGDTFDAWRERAPHGFLYALKFSRYGSHLKYLKDPWDVIGNFLEAVPGDLRWAVEVRDPSWLWEDVYDILRWARAALCIHDLIEDHPRRITAGWTYLRYHGDRYAGSYSHQKLTSGPARIVGRLVSGIDVFACFNNDRGGHAVFGASDLRRYVASRCGAEGPESSAVPGTGRGGRGTEGGT